MIPISAFEIAMFEEVWSMGVACGWMSMWRVTYRFGSRLCGGGGGCEGD